MFGSLEKQPKVRIFSYLRLQERILDVFIAGEGKASRINKMVAFRCCILLPFDCVTPGNWSGRIVQLRVFLAGLFICSCRLIFMSSLGTEAFLRGEVISRDLVGEVAVSLYICRK